MSRKETEEEEIERVIYNGMLKVSNKFQKIDSIIFRQEQTHQ
jgi:hypothetical protein